MQEHRFNATVSLKLSYWSCTKPQSGSLSTTSGNLGCVLTLWDLKRLSDEVLSQQVTRPVAGLQMKSHLSSSRTKLGKPLTKKQKEE